MNFPRLTGQEDVHINLTPLIDVVFMLLVFFILTTSFVKENRLSILLPEAQSHHPESENALVVVVDAHGNYIINDKKLADNHRDTVSLEMQRARAEINPKELEITADARVEHRSVVLLMDVAGQLGFTNIRITTREADAP